MKMQFEKVHINRAVAIVLFGALLTTFAIVSDALAASMEANSKLWHELEETQKEIALTCEQEYNRIEQRQAQLNEENDRERAKRICEGIAIIESSNCKRTAGTNNCHGIMEWSTGKRKLVRYESTADSFRACEDLWFRKYRGELTWEKAVRWSGNPNPVNWFDIVNEKYKSYDRQD